LINEFTDYSEFKILWGLYRKTAQILNSEPS